MPRAKQTKPGAAIDTAAASRKAKTQPMLTHERIAEDMAAFKKAGGRVEVLGVTRTLTKIDAAPAAESTPAPVPASAKRPAGKASR